MGISKTHKKCIKILQKVAKKTKIRLAWEEEAQLHSTRKDWLGEGRMTKRRPFGLRRLGWKDVRLSGVGRKPVRFV
ncbi:hypothetical protein Csa_005651 [Cucumis sativus]|uniref:Uncharacterized protein n=1 Tax=Cucumis sativus TaxID=3659 RepID=A0A0A0K7U4_CUCSA|nr:hypothetical protein Csa_005651 [Cucumis sativus]